MSSRRIALQNNVQVVDPCTGGSFSEVTLGISTKASCYDHYFLVPTFIQRVAHLTACIADDCVQVTSLAMST